MSESDDIRKFSFTWKIENFSMLPHQMGEYLDSPVFVTDTWKGIEWHLQLFPRGSEYKDYVSCFLQAKSTEKKYFKINFSLTLESTDPKKEITGKGPYQLPKPTWGWRKFSSLTEIYAKKSLYLPQDILSIRCHLTPMDSNDDQLTLNNKIECATSFLDNVNISRTSIRMQQKSITCSIQNVSTRREPVEMSFNEMMKDSPALKMILNFREVVNNINIPIEIQLTAPGSLDEKQERLFLKCKITVVGVVKEYQDSKEGTYLFESELYDVWNFPLFLKTSNLVRGKYLNQEDALVLLCDFAFSYKSGVYHWDVSDGLFPLRKKDETSNLSTSIQNLCASGKFSDVELKAGGETFPSHKLLLCARSSVFCAMFENDMKEKISGVVKIDDVDPATLKRMLAFINFDDIKEKDISPEELSKLYEAADKYNIVPLRRWCTMSLVPSLCVENVCDVLVLADAHHDDFLMTCVRNFICCHEAETFDSPFWESFMQSNTKLATKVMLKVLANRK